MGYPNAEEVKQDWREGPRDAKSMARKVGIEIKRDVSNVNRYDDDDDPHNDTPEEPPESSSEEDPSDTEEQMESDAPDNDPDVGPHRRLNNGWFKKSL